MYSYSQLGDIKPEDLDIYSMCCIHAAQKRLSEKDMIDKFKKIYFYINNGQISNVLYLGYGILGKTNGENYV